MTTRNHQADNPLCVWAESDWWFASLEKYGHTWHRMSLLRPGVIKQHKHKPTLSLSGEKTIKYQYIIIPSNSTVLVLL